MTNYQIVNNEELYHHGILGQKWGIRRYQNYDGSYTQAGMKRYNKSLDAYKSANERYKKAKKNKEDKVELVNSKMARKKAMRQLDKDYKHLKQDKLGDKGKALYANGKTITGSRAVTNALNTIGSMALTAAVYNYNYRIIGNDAVTKALAAIGGTSLAASGAKYLYDESNAKKLRAYYSHTSNY